MKISGNSVVAIRKFDAFSKPFEELSVRTLSGALCKCIRWFVRQLRNILKYWFGIAVTAA